MKTKLLTFVAILFLGASFILNAQTPKGFSIKPSQNLKKLPALQSFVFGQSGKYWVMIGGRTNGFHGFDPNAYLFPFKKANKYIYVYNTAINKLDSMSTSFLPAALREQYTSTNMQHFQVGNYLYVSGGYGEFHAKLPDSSWVTYSTLSRINMSQLISAVLTKNINQFATSVVYAKSKLTAATGGEMFKLPDGKFYLALGHRYNGKYGTGNTSQVYLDSVHVFRLTETASSISITPNSMQYISDNLPDSITQFRRRDLLVVPAIRKGGKEIGLTVYGGVFTYGPGVPFRNPIYIKGGSTPSYVLDKTYTQTSNIYSTANVEMYDAQNDVMLTTAFGGIGEDMKSGGSSDAFTKKIMTISRNNRTNVTTEIVNPTTLPTYMGSEGVFISAPNVPMYNSSYDIINYNAIPAGKTTLIGYIYGGIVSSGTAWGPTNPTASSNMVYEVYITK
jgi:hypothetical protein